MAARDSRPTPGKTVWDDGGLSEVYDDYRDVGLRAVCGEESRLPADVSDLVSDAKANSEVVHLVGSFTDDASRTEGGRFEVTLFESDQGAVTLRILDISGQASVGEPSILVDRPGADGFEQRWVRAHTERLAQAGVNVVEQNQRPVARVMGRRRGPYISRGRAVL